MKYDLTSVGIYPNLQYECIYTTIDSNKQKNSAAFAFIYLGDDRVRCRIFEGSKTLKNIRESKEYVVNITQDPIIFTQSTIDKLDSSYYTDDDEIAILKNAGSYLIIDVEKIDTKSPHDFPIKNDNRLFFIEGRIRDFTINDDSVKAFNRGLSCLIESLVNFSRYKIVNEKKRQHYLSRLIENKRIIDTVSDDNTRKAMDLLVEEYKKN